MLYPLSYGGSVRPPLYQVSLALPRGGKLTAVDLAANVACAVALAAPIPAGKFARISLGWNESTGSMSQKKLALEKSESKSTRESHSRSRVTRVVAGASAGAILMSGIVGATGVSAAPGDAFGTKNARIYIAQDLKPTKLSIATMKSGGFGFTGIGSQANFAYNAIGFNTADNYIYGIRRDNGSQNATYNNNLLRIGQAGKITGLGPVAGLPANPIPKGVYNAGVFGEGASQQTLFVRTASDNNDENKLMYAVDVKKKTAKTINLSKHVPNTSDIIFAHGFVWGFGMDNKVYRINPTSGAVGVFPTGHSLGQVFGAQWRFGNGNFGLSQNNTGTIYQVSVTNPSSSSPKFAIVSRSSGPKSGNNDGTYSPGRPADLSITTTGPAVAGKGQRMTYSIVVKNNGPGESTGSVVTTTLPSKLSKVETSTPGCSVTGRKLTCSVKALKQGETAVVKVSAVPTASKGKISTTAKVLGNEKDPKSSNNKSKLVTTLKRAQKGNTCATNVGTPKRKGSKTVVRCKAKTNIGKVINWRVVCSPVSRGEVNGCSYSVRSNGKVVIRTYGHKSKISLIGTAPGNTKYAPYRIVHSWTV